MFLERDMLPALCLLSSVLCFLSSVSWFLSSVFCFFLFSVFCPRFPVLCVLSSVFCLLFSDLYSRSSVFDLLCFVSCLLFSVSSFCPWFSQFYLQYHVFCLLCWSSVLTSVFCLILSVFCIVYSAHIPQLFIFSVVYWFLFVYILRIMLVFVVVRFIVLPTRSSSEQNKYMHF